ncbi:MAG: alpha/beta hydrolase [Rhodothermales bacterium]
MEEHPITSVLKFFLLSLLALVALVSTGLLYRMYEQNRVTQLTKISTPGGIDLLGNVPLGEEEQWVLIRGQKQTNPVLLYLHGGPGSFVIPRARDFGLPLEEDFVVVYWDQRGSGKSYRPGLSAESMDIERFIADTHELVEVLKRRFNVPKIYLAGNSWGSALGMLVAERYPESFYAFVGTGQLVNTARSEALSYEFTLREARNTSNREAIRELEEMGPPPWDYRTMNKQRKWLRRFGGTIYKEREAPGSFLSDFMGRMLLSPEYTLLEILEISSDPNFAVRTLWDDLGQINLFEDVPRVNVPVYFIAGRHDYNTPSELVRKYFDQLDAPAGKHLIWFEDAAHMPEFEKPEQFHRVMVDSVLAQTYPHYVYTP